MTSVTLEEKRLKQLKQQLFGKEDPLVYQPRISKVQNADKPQTATIDSISLKKDFLKIISFSFLILAIQLLLYFANKQGFVNLFNQ